MPASTSGSTHDRVSGAKRREGEGCAIIIFPYVGLLTKCAVRQDAVDYQVDSLSVPLFFTELPAECFDKIKTSRSSVN